MLLFKDRTCRVVCTAIVALLVAISPGEPLVAGKATASCDVPSSDRIVPSPEKAFRGRLERLHNGRPVKLSALHRADVYVLYFGASWCGPCGAFARAIKPIYESGEPAVLGYELIFVSKDTPPKDVAYVRAIGMPWPYLRDDTVGALASIGGRVLPDLVVVDRFGRVLCRAVDATGRSAGVRQTFDRMRAARRRAMLKAAG